MTLSIQDEILRIYLKKAQQDFRGFLLNYAKEAGNIIHSKGINSSQCSGIADLARNPDYDIDYIKNELQKRTEKKWDNVRLTPHLYRSYDDFFAHLKKEAIDQVQKIADENNMSEDSKTEMEQALFLAYVREYLLAAVEFSRFQE